MGGYIALDLIHKGKFDFLVKLIFRNSIYDKVKHNILLPLVQEKAYEIGVENYKHQLSAILNKSDQSPLLANIECPTLLLASQQDRVMPFERSKYMARKIKNAELIYLKGCGHLATLEQPDEINQILAKWL
jgi:pimeloyl-ACP methyl ester carboxylesterase